jgi:hypothetical protein
MGNEIINQMLTGSSIWGNILFFVAIFLIFLPIYFMIGSLTRLTDIKYKLDDIISILSQKSDTKNDSTNEDADVEQRQEDTSRSVDDNEG